MALHEISWGQKDTGHPPKPAPGDGRKRVLAIVAGILVAHSRAHQERPASCQSQGPHPRPQGWPRWPITHNCVETSTTQRCRCFLSQCELNTRARLRSAHCCPKHAHRRTFSVSPKGWGALGFSWPTRESPTHHPSAPSLLAEPKQAPEHQRSDTIAVVTHEQIIGTIVISPASVDSHGIQFVPKMD